MLNVVLRTAIVYFFVVLTLRLMGKRQIGELEASELVVTIIISEIAAMPITDLGVPLASSILAILILMVLEILLSYLAYRNVYVRTFLYGKPSVFYQKGKIDQQEMKRQRFNVADLMEELRNNGAVSLNEVDFVLMEPNGKVSVIMKAEHSPVTPSDMRIQSSPMRMNYVIVDNGNLIRANMKRLGLDDTWLKTTLKKRKLNSVRDIFYLSMEEETGQMVLLPKDKKAGGKKR